MTNEQPPVPSASWLLQQLVGVACASDDAGLITATSPDPKWLGHRPGDLIGAHVTDLGVETGGREAAEGVVVGPVRTVVGADPDAVQVEAWTVAHGVGGTHVLMPVSAAVEIVRTLADLVEGATLEAVAEGLCRAVSAPPLSSDAALVRRAGQDVDVLARRGVPAALVDGVIVDATFNDGTSGTTRTISETEELDGPWRDLTTAAGYRAIWFEPARLGTVPASATLIVCRRDPGPPTPIELTYLRQAAALFGLALRR